MAVVLEDRPLPVGPCQDDRQPKPWGSNGPSANPTRRELLITARQLDQS